MRERVECERDTIKLMVAQTKRDEIIQNKITQFKKSTNTALCVYEHQHFSYLYSADCTIIIIFFISLKLYNYFTCIRFIFCVNIWLCKFFNLSRSTSL